MPTPLPIHPWVFPERRWQCLHVDFCSSVFGHIWLVSLDAYSKRPELVPFTGMPLAAAPIETLQAIFALFGRLEQLVPDYGRQFTLKKRKIF